MPRTASNRIGIKLPRASHARVEKYGPPAIKQVNRILSKSRDIKMVRYRTGCVDEHEVPPLRPIGVTYYNVLGAGGQQLLPYLSLDYYVHVILAVSVCAILTSLVYET